MKISYQVSPYYGETEEMHMWTAIDDGTVIGGLWADLYTGQIMQIEVDEDRRGEGIARALYETAAAQVDIYHAPPEHRTPEGDAFATAVGGPTISAALAYQPEEQE